MRLKNLYIIGGPMGVGKTTVCEIMKKKLDRAVFLDGDRCWDADPFVVNDETKRMVEGNICYLLNSFIRCSAFENIIFCWVLHKKRIIDNICANLDLQNCKVKKITLLCSPEELCSRLEKDIENGKRLSDEIERSLQRLSLCSLLDTYKIDTTSLSPEEITDRIIATH